MTDKLRAAAEMALEALQEYTDVVATAHDADNWHQVIDGGKPARGAIQALRQALDQLPDATKMIDTGVDRGAWSDVPDATKWVDELRGDDDWDHPPQRDCECKHCKEYWVNQYRDEQYNLIDKFLRNNTDDEWYPAYRNALDRIYHAPYVAPPKREWQGLTDEEIYTIAEDDEIDWPAGGTLTFARLIEARLKENNA